MAASSHSGVNTSNLSGQTKGELVREIERLRTQLAHAESARQDIAASHERFSELVAHAPVVIWSLDRSGIFTRSEGGGLAALGLQPDEVIGRSVFEVYGDVPEILALTRRALEGHTATGIIEVGQARFEVWCTPLRASDGEVTGALGIATDISEHRREEDRLRQVVEGTSATTGEHFFRSLVEQLAAALDTRGAFACELTDPKQQHLRSLSTWVDGEHAVALDYDARGTPCEHTLGKRAAYYPANLQEQFPGDDWLHSRGLSCYLGVSIMDHGGAPLGVLGVLHDHPLPDRRLAESILHIFAGRAGAELERQRASAALMQTQRRLETQNRALARLSRNEAIGTGDLNAALRAVTEAAAETLGVARVNVWVYCDHDTRIRCLDHYDLTSGRHASGAELTAEKYPAYFRALETQRMIAADNALTDERTREFRQDYLEPAGITSMLDAPIRLRGQMQGIVCHEHVGTPRHWTAEEEQFASTIADFAALALESHQRRRAEEELQKARDLLEERVEERTARLTTTNRRLREEIDARRRSEQALRESEARFRRLFAANIIGVMFANVDGQITHANDAFLRMVGRRHGDLPLDWATITPSEWADQDRAALAELRATGAASPREKEFFRADGSRLPVLLGAALLEGSRDTWIAFVIDLTQRKRAEAALKQSEEKWRSLVSTAPDIILIVGLDGAIQYINRSIAGIRNEDVIGTSAFDHIAPQHHDLVREHMQTVLQTGQFSEYEVLGPGPDGTSSWYTTRIGPFQQDGQVVGFTLIARDITEHRRAVQALRESEHKFRQLANTMTAATFIFQDLRILYVNPAAAKISGYAGDELLRMPFTDVIHPEFRRLAERRGMARQQGLDVPRRYELKILRKDGKSRWVEFTAADIMYEGLPAVLGTAFDITDRKHAEEELLANQRFLQKLIETQERDRRLTAYEIHDGMVQDVTGALMHLETFRRRQLPPAGPDRDELDESIRLMRTTLDEARRLISGLRPPIIDEQGVLAAIEYLLSDRQVPEGIDVVFEHDVRFNRLDMHLENAIFRIVQEALNNVYRHSQAERAQVRLTQTDSWLKLEIRDWGTGFDPLDVRGDRFGLQGIRERARVFGGRATIESRAGEGTRVLVELPVLLPPADEDGRSKP